MQIVFSTNLDEAKGDVFDLNFMLRETPPPHVPRVGERIQFDFHRGEPRRRFLFELEVVAVAYNYASDTIQVELHLPAWQRSMSVLEWTEWFRRHRYGA